MAAHISKEYVEEVVRENKILPAFHSIHTCLFDNKTNNYYAWVDRLLDAYNAQPKCFKENIRQENAFEYTVNKMCNYFENKYVNIKITPYKPGQMEDKDGSS